MTYSFCSMRCGFSGSSVSSKVECISVVLPCWSACSVVMIVNSDIILLLLRRLCIGFLGGMVQSMVGRLVRFR